MSKQSGRFRKPVLPKSVTIINIVSSTKGLVLLALAVLILCAIIVLLQQKPIFIMAPTDLTGTASQQYIANTSQFSTVLPAVTNTQNIPITETPNVDTRANSVHAYDTISLDNINNARLDFESTPVGEFTFDGIPFVIGDKVFKSQASTSPDDAFPSSAAIPLNMPHAYRLYLLLNAGNGFNRFSGQEIGKVVVHCGNSQLPIIELVLGQNIREWHMASNVVSTAPETKQVWTGAIRNYPNLVGHLDMLRINLPEDCQSAGLTRVDIIDASTTTVNSLDPALNLAGVTIEYSQK